MSSHYFAMLSRMKHIIRWGLMRNTTPENLSEHSLETAFIAHALAVIGNRRLGKSYNADRAALLAMFHDTTEIITGDLPTPIKYNNPKIKNAYKEIESSAADELLSLLPEDLRADYREIYHADDQDSPDRELSRFVHAADKLSALIKCIEERRMGNDEFRTAEQTIRETVDGLHLPEVDIFVAEFLQSFGLTLDEQREAIDRTAHNKTDRRRTEKTQNGR